MPLAKLYCLVKSTEHGVIRCICTQGISPLRITDLSEFQIQRVRVIQVYRKTHYIPRNLTNNIVRIQRIWRWYRKCIKIMSNPKTLFRREQGFKIDLPTHPERAVHQAREMLQVQNQQQREQNIEGPDDQ